MTCVAVSREVNRKFGFEVDDDWIFLDDDWPADDGAPFDKLDDLSAFHLACVTGRWGQEPAVASQ